MNFRANGAAVTFLEDMHYYPFGMLMEGMGVNSPGNDYTYNGKELNEDFGLNLYDYGARWYDAALGRWWSVDPLGEMTSSISTYAYVLNNPLSLIDPTGMFAVGTMNEAYEMQQEQSAQEAEERAKQNNLAAAVDGYVNAGGIVSGDGSSEFVSKSGGIVVSTVTESQKWSPGLTYSGKDENVKQTFQALHDLYSHTKEGLVDISFLKAGSKEKVTGNALTDFLSGGLYSQVNVTIIPTTFAHHISYGDPNEFSEPSIYFNPFEGHQLEKGLSQSAGRVSPHILLLHELSHIWYWQTNPNLYRQSKSLLSPIGNIGSEELALKVQNNAAKLLGQGITIYHHKFNSTYETTSSTSTVPK